MFIHPLTCQQLPQTFCRGELYVVDMDITVAIHTYLRIAFHEHVTVSSDTVHCIVSAFLRFIEIGGYIRTSQGAHIHRTVIKHVGFDSQVTVAHIIIIINVSFN